MFRNVTLLAFGLFLVGCNASQTSSPVVTSIGPGTMAQPSPAQVAARNAWLACLDRSSRFQSRLGRAAAADLAFSACQTEEETLVARLSQDPTLTPASARAGLQRVKADWKRDHLKGG